MPSSVQKKKISMAEMKGKMDRKVGEEGWKQEGQWEREGKKTEKAGQGEQRKHAKEGRKGKGMD